MHTEMPPLIKDRRHHFRPVQCCFVGKETVRWLLNTGQAPDRDTAVFLMNILLNNNVCHQVNDECQFKDENILYRFRKDDGTFPWHEDVQIFLSAQKMFNKLRLPGTTVMGTKEKDGLAYRNAFIASALIDWLINNQEMKTREDATKLCRRYLQNDIIRHVTDEHHFKDSDLLYQFKMDFGHKLELLDLVLPPPLTTDDTPGTSIDTKESEISDAPADSTESNVPNKSNNLEIPGSMKAERSESGYHSDHASSSDMEPSPSASSFTGSSLGNATTKIKNMQITNKSIPLHRIATAEELEAPNAPYVRKSILVMTDPVGFGFVIRGEGPVYVKTVDPTGPAALAGLKVGHYIYMVNDEVVLHMNHRDLAHLVLASGYLRLCVLEHRPKNI